METNEDYPVLIESVDRSTAFDVAGKGVSKATGMLEAIRIAVEYASYGPLK